MNAAKKITYGDWQTPLALAKAVCLRLAQMGVEPDVVLEPTCGKGAFVLASLSVFPEAKVLGYEINRSYLNELARQVDSKDVELTQADFFLHNWETELEPVKGRLLVLGNLPWATSAVLGSLGGGNLPEKSNFLKHKGFDAITGKSNFDISEWMLIEICRWMRGRNGDVAMLVKTATARKVVNHARDMGLGLASASITKIDAKQHFDVSVDACLLLLQFDPGAQACADYDVFSSLNDIHPHRVGHRNGLTVSDLNKFEASEYLLGQSPQKWRSGVKHDAGSVMELTFTGGQLRNGLGEVVDLESTYLYSLMKGSDVANAVYRDKFVLVTQKRTNEDTSEIAAKAPKTWAYLLKHKDVLDGRSSSIYAKNAQFSVFGIGDYAFRPYRIAICGLYKKLAFRLIEPRGKPVMFDDTVYYVSFDTLDEAKDAYRHITSKACMDLYSSLIFWDEKRPIKASVLNSVNWTRASPEQFEADYEPSSLASFSPTKAASRQ